MVCRWLSSFNRAFGVNLSREMTERVMIASQLDQRRKLACTNLFSTFAAGREWTTGRQTREIRGLSRNLIELAMFSRRIGNGTKQPTRVWVAGPLEKFAGG